MDIDEYQARHAADEARLRDDISDARKTLARAQQRLDDLTEQWRILPHRVEVDGYAISRDSSSFWSTDFCCSKRDHQFAAPTAERAAQFVRQFHPKES